MDLQLGRLGPGQETTNGWDAAKGGHGAVGSRDGVIGGTAGRTGEGTEGSCRPMLPRCHEDEAAGSSSALPAEAWP